ncbi:MAG: hypothetical protein H0T46_19800 [Deltaproteobacteria bacterium]|nr:hypothetical protein [Deltaproteobacteria bacterium]
MAQSPPPWCAKAEGRLDSNAKEAFTSKDARWAVFYLVGSYCKPDSEAKSMAKELESAKKKWSAKLDMQEQDWADAAEWASMDQGSRMNRDLKHDKKRAWSSLTPGQQFALIDFDFNEDGPAYAADALGAKLSEVGRFAYIQKCIKASDNQQAASWAMCQPDIDAFDKKKFSEQLRVDTGITGAERMEIRLRYEGFADELKQHAEEVKKLQAKDGGYATMFKTAAQGYADFAKVDPTAIALMADMDDARVTNSRKAFEGCSARAWPAWKKAVSALPAKKFANFKREPGDENEIVQALGVILGDPAGYLTSVSLYICEGVGAAERGNMDYLVKAAGNSASRWPGFRGPRRAALTAMMLNGVTLDDRDARIDYPTVHHDWMSQNMSSGGGGRGVVAKVAIKGEKATVTVKKEFEKQQQCQSWKSSNKIVQITSSGSLIYESWCTSSKSVTVDRSFDPQTVKARYVEGLKPGMVFTNTEDVAGVVYAKNGAKEPVSICSAPVK